MKTCSVFVFLAALVFSSPSFAQESSPADFQEFLDAWEGRWTGTGTDIDGNEMVGHADCRVAGDGNTMIVNVYMGDASGIWFIVYDSNAKRIRSQWGQSDGEATQAILYKDGEDWIQEGSGSNGEGKKITYKHRISISGDGPTHRWTRTLMVDGEKKTAKDTWQRVAGSFQEK
ncbi:hypothetical protein NZK35_08655 [Stieleria sp. ICT_E10.1]|uniref:hypothetical protein n=1 Tax=Stieleria sedimenti TaxID=2976331 RepID=UPI0021802490|nr:hypothetical protein [Stieleria sedimenti]MCS7466712.1 hypothetical protein [Stieleria sedimenti]